VPLWTSDGGLSPPVDTVLSPFNHSFTHLCLLVILAKAGFLLAVVRHMGFNYKDNSRFNYLWHWAWILTKSLYIEVSAVTILINQTKRPRLVFMIA
jgi:hypothetical protein